MNQTRKEHAAASNFPHSQEATSWTVTDTPKNGLSAPGHYPG